MTIIGRGRLASAEASVGFSPAADARTARRYRKASMDALTISPMLKLGRVSNQQVWRLHFELDFVRLGYIEADKPAEDCIDASAVGVIALKQARILDRSFVKPTGDFAADPERTPH
jgi:uncharacterized protein YlaN (UPF0358 family)